MTRFIEVVNTATGIEQQVPEDYLDNPVLGKGLEKTVAQKVADGEVEPAAVAEPPTERDTHEVIDDFAKTAGIDLGDAKTKAEKLEVINAALASAAPAPTDAGPAPEFPNPDVQLVHGDVDDQPIIPALRSDFTPDDATPSTETPVAGDEE